MKSMRVMSALAVLAAAGAPAFAAFSGINAPPGTELGHQDIFQGVYGGVWAAAGLDFTNGPITAHRVSDSGFAGDMNVLSGGYLSAQDDQTWDDGIVFSEARARYAGFAQRFGWVNGDDNTDSTTFNQIMNVTGTGINPATDPFVNPTLFAAPFRFARANSAAGFNMFVSNDGDNVDFADHMVTYEITGVDGRKRWMLFFEDQAVGSGDFDYNDIVVELVVVPLPSSALAGLAGLGLVGTGMAARRRRLAR